MTSLLFWTSIGVMALGCAAIAALMLSAGCAAPARTPHQWCILDCEHKNPDDWYFCEGRCR